MTLQETAQLLVKFGALFQLPEPQTNYIEALHEELANWPADKFKRALDWLKGDSLYNATARYNKYPTIFEIYRAESESR